MPWSPSRRISTSLMAAARHFSSQPTPTHHGMMLARAIIHVASRIDITTQRSSRTPSGGRPAGIAASHRSLPASRRISPPAFSADQCCHGESAAVSTVRPIFGNRNDVIARFCWLLLDRYTPKSRSDVIPRRRPQFPVASYRDVIVSQNAHLRR